MPGSDFHLLSSSPAVDAGTPVGAPSVDLEGNPRPVGAGIDLGAYEVQLLECGDGGIDPGEECGEPGLSCADGQVCAGCTCVTPSLCTSGIGLVKPRLALKASPGRLKLRDDESIPEPWVGIDPPSNGIRLVVDSTPPSGGVDVTIPGGAAWTTGTRRWTYRDPNGAVGGVIKVVVQDRRTRGAGMLRVVAKGKAASYSLPDVSAARTTIVVGAPSECASIAWGGPSGALPRCRGDAAKITCK